MSDEVPSVPKLSVVSPDGEERELVCVELKRVDTEGRETIWRSKQLDAPAVLHAFKLNPIPPEYAAKYGAAIILLTRELAERKPIY